jgi:lipoate-protein ligase B
VGLEAVGTGLLVSLGVAEYDRALALQHELVRLRQSDELPDMLVLLEHLPVVTLGRSADETNLLVSRSELARRGIEVRRVERGGEVTYHGPGQLVGYPVFRLSAGIAGIRWFVRGVEQALALALSELGVSAGSRPGLVGVWAGDRKIASIGVAVKRSVTFHGFALNVTTDLRAFGLMNPCGLGAVRMTSVRAERGETDSARVRQAVGAAFEQVFRLRFQTHLPRSVTVLTEGLSSAAIASASARE